MSNNEEFLARFQKHEDEKNAAIAAQKLKDEEEARQAAIIYETFSEQIDKLARNARAWIKGSPLAFDVRTESLMQQVCGYPKLYELNSFSISYRHNTITFYPGGFIGFQHYGFMEIRYTMPPSHKMYSIALHNLGDGKLSWKFSDNRNLTELNEESFLEFLLKSFGI